VAINDVLPHIRPSDAMPLPIKNLLAASGHQRLYFDGFIFIHHVAPPYSTGIVITASVYGGWVKNPVLYFGIRHIVFFAERRAGGRVAERQQSAGHRDMFER